MPKFKNISNDVRFVPAHGRSVKPGDAIEVSDDDAIGFALQVGAPGSAWDAADASAKKAVKDAQASDVEPTPEPAPTPEPSA